MSKHPDPVLREAGPADLPALCALLSLRDDRAYEPARVRHALHDFDPVRGRVYAAWIGDRPAGLSAFEQVELETPAGIRRAGYWTNLFIAPEFRARLLYPRLPLLMLQGAREAGVSAFYAAVRRLDVAAAHRALGFAEFARRDVLVQPLQPLSALLARRGVRGLARAAAQVGDAAWGAGARAWRALAGQEPGRAVAGDAGAPVLGRFLATPEPAIVRRHWGGAELADRLAPHLDGGAYETRVGADDRGAVLWRMVERAGGLRIGVVCGAFAGPGAPARALARLVRGVVSECARQDGAMMVALASTDSTVAQALRAAGFVRSPETYVFLEAQRLAGRADPLLALDWRWDFRFVDHDAI